MEKYNKICKKGKKIFMSKAIHQFLFLILIMLLVLLSFNSKAEQRFVELNRIAIEVERAIGTNRDFTIPENEEKAGELNLILEAKYLGFLYSRDRVESMYTDSQFRFISLTKEFAVKPYDDLEVYYQHTSEHALDFEYDNIQKYPNINSIGFRLILFER